MDRTDLMPLAAAYRRAAGDAFARGDDAAATRYREAATLLDETRGKLPELPVRTAREK